MEIVVINDGAQSAAIYPTTGEQIDTLGVNAAYVLTPTVKTVRMICPVAGSWKAGAAAVVGGSTSVVGSRGSPTAIVAGTGVPFIGSSMTNTWYVSGSGGPVTVTANPQIAAGTIVGQTLRLIVPTGANQLTFADGTGLDLDGPLIMAAGSAADFEWDGTSWFIVNRRTA
jgi:hypothetical protein